MTKALLVAAVLGLSLAGAKACEFERSAKVDNTTVATQSMSAPADTASTTTAPAEPVKDGGATVDKDG